MLVPDSTLFTDMVALASFFTAMGLVLPVGIATRKLKLPLLVTYLRATIMPAFAAATWFVVGVMAGSLSNYSYAYGAVLAPNGTELAVGALTANPFYWLSWLFYGLGIANVVILIAITIYMVAGSTELEEDVSKGVV
jgi:hypothetical protein